MADFLALFDGNSTCNVVHMVPHAAIRVAAMGWSSRLPTDAELQTMRDLTRQGMRDGAFGFTTGLTYAPGAYSDTNELAAIAAVAAEEGGFYCTHARYTLGDRLLDPFREALEIGRRSGAPVHISHYHSPVAGLGAQMTAWSTRPTTAARTSPTTNIRTRPPAPSSILCCRTGSTPADRRR